MAAGRLENTDAPGSASPVTERKLAGRSLVWRLVRTAALWVVPALLITAMALIWFYRNSTYRIFDDPLLSTIQALIASVETAPGGINALGIPTAEGRLTLASQPVDPRYQLALSGRYWLVGELAEDGSVNPVFRSPSLSGGTLKIPQNDAAKITEKQGEIFRSTAIGPDQEPLRLAVQKVFFSGNASRPLVIIAAADRRAAMRAVWQFAYLAFGMMSVLALGLAVAMFMQVRMGLRPLFDLRRRVEDVREGRAETVEGAYPKEIMPLASELNSLISHNKNVVDYAQTHVANLAHALKTPIAVLKNESHAHKSALSDIVGRQADAMSKQVDHHLRRARAAARGQAIGAKTPVKDTLDSFVRTLPRIYRDKDLDIEQSVETGLVFRGEKRDLEEMVGNLLDNACKWTNSRINISAKPSESHENRIVIVIDDDGPGLKPGQYSEVLKRGARLDEATPGSGFGLSIVNDLALAYNGRLELDKSPLGGLRTILTVPSVTDPG